MESAGSALMTVVVAPMRLTLCTFVVVVAALFRVGVRLSLGDLLDCRPK